jgi:hypothetical protein
MAKLAGFAAFIAVFLGLLGIGEMLGLFGIQGPDLPQWSYKPISLFLAGFVLSLAVMAFRVAEASVKRIPLRPLAAADRARSLRFHEIKCQNPDCKAMNRVRKYSIRQIPVCRKCREPLPEPLPMRLRRFGYVNPLLLASVGGTVIIVGFVFLDRYSPGMGFIWNVINGRVAGFPYPYVLTLGILLMVLSLGVARQK